MNNPRSESLFHFTRNYENLESILRDGFKTNHCLEDIGWFGVENAEALAYPMTCFCDIPLSRISSHTGQYGKYGIGLTKEWGLRNKLAPVIYATKDSAAANVARYLMNLYFDGPHLNVDTSELNKQFYGLMSLIKPITGRPNTGEIQERDFYQENEWRFVPDRCEVIQAGLYEALRNGMQQHEISFNANDIKYLFVENDNEILQLWNFIFSKLERFSQVDRKVLTTKIISLQTLKSDV